MILTSGILPRLCLMRFLCIQCFLFFFLSILYVRTHKILWICVSPSGQSIHINYSECFYISYLFLSPYLSLFSCCCGKVLWGKKLTGKKVDSGTWIQGIISHGRCVKGQELESSWSHHIHNQEAERGEFILLFIPLPLPATVQNPKAGNDTACCGARVLTSINKTKKIPLKSVRCSPCRWQGDNTNHWGSLFIHLLFSKYFQLHGLAQNIVYVGDCPMCHWEE